MSENGRVSPRPERTPPPARTKGVASLERKLRAPNVDDLVMAVMTRRVPDAAPK